jgi:hypothetical protein
LATAVGAAAAPLIGLSWSGSRLVAPPLGTLTLQHAGQDALWGGCAALGLVAGVGHLLRR